MKQQIKTENVGTYFLAIILMALCAATTARAADLQGQIVLRPLTEVDVATYGLSDTNDYSGGLSTIGIGAPAYLEADVNIAIAPTDITSVTWSLTAKPSNSAAVLVASPLGTNVPVYEPSQRLVSQVASRRVLRPDLVGQYTVTATITTASSGSTNVSQTITATTYMGIQTCAACHSGGVVAPDKYSTWSQTLHSKVFAHEIDGVEEFSGVTHLAASCLECHTTGNDPNPLAVNGGFDDLATLFGWTLPTVANGNWASMTNNYPEVANLANVQCESCHGPGYSHVIAEAINPHGAAGKAAIAVNYTSGACNQCHDAAVYHAYGTEWLNSLHAVTTTHPSGPGEEDCVRCHTGLGFIQYVDGVTNNIDPTYFPINCQACHEPHGETDPAGNPHQIRAMTPVTFEDGTTVTNAGEGLLCMNCHHARVDAKTYATSYHSHFGPHHGPQGDMLEGVNGFSYDKAIPSSAHRNAVTNTCATCHMQKLDRTDPDLVHVGGHTFEIAHNGRDLVGACQQCHGPSVTDFDFPLQDYDGDGVIDGVQTEVQHLLDKLALLLPPVGQPKTTVSPDATWTSKQLEAAYNYLFVQEDGSMGIHNTAYAVGLLKASIADLTDDANNDGIADTWQIQYFGSINNPLAAPNATPAGDNYPNWLKYALGLDPTVPGIVVPGGVVWADAGGIGGGTNTIHIYTAAEIAFDTEVGKTYQIQGISSLGGGWQNIGNPIPGTGAAISYVAKTRGTSQQYYRVIHTQ
jgi:Cytochrome c554 and c-prime